MGWSSLSFVWWWVAQFPLFTWWGIPRNSDNEDTEVCWPVVWGLRCFAGAGLPGLRPLFCAHWSWHNSSA